MKSFKLCYIDGENSLKKAFFSQKDPIKVTGDDWNDVPYEHNAGEPYTSTHPNDEIKELVFESEKYETPAQIANGNSQYSVDMINNKNTPWLACRWGSKDDIKEPIFAGVEMEEFIKLIKKSGGKVYKEVK